MKQTVCKRTAATYLYKNKVWSPVLLADTEEREREGVRATHLDFWCRDQDFGLQNVEIVANGGAIT